MNRFISRCMLLIVILVAFLSFSGCMGLTSSGDTGEKNKPKPAKSRETTAVYYDFEDVLIPKELEVVDEYTMVVSTPGYTSGIMAFKGRVEKRSLFNFFNNNMMKDNWNVVSQIKSPGTTIMVFDKSSRCAVISIKEKNFYTYVEVGVAPTVGDESMMEENEITF
ncbi:MAG: hypothetical protein R6V41_11165 [Desulfobacteraceae bacterium]